MNIFYKNLGMLIIGLFLIFIMFNGFSFKNNFSLNEKENFKNIDDVSNELDSNTLLIINANNTDSIKQYESNYEKLIHKLDSNVSLAIIKYIKDNAISLSKEHMSEKTQEIINKLTNLKKFKDTLNTAQDILDNYSYEIN